MLQRPGEDWLFSVAAFEVLGWPNYRCGPAAHLFAATGEDIRPRAEDEQAFVIRWLLTLVRDHGEGWRKAAAAEIERRAALQAAAKAAMAATSGPEATEAGAGLA